MGIKGAPASAANALLTLPFLASTPSIYALSPTLVWSVAGAILCLMEFFFPTAFIEFMMGLGALLVAGVCLLVPGLPFTLQVALWLVFSVILVALSRRYLSPKRPTTIAGEDSQGETLTEIPPGKTGRVLYEGNSWRARCDLEDRAIGKGETVYIVGREGNTLIIMPHNILHS
ncbi:MAG: NfeD family protein [Cyanobacteriota bacterium]|nr:NfeD family protein [Cyanobacteriota bacterium]